MLEPDENFVEDNAQLLRDLGLKDISECSAFDKALLMKLAEMDEELRELRAVCNRYEDHTHDLDNGEGMIYGPTQSSGPHDG